MGFQYLSNVETLYRTLDRDNNDLEFRIKRNIGVLFFVLYTKCVLARKMLRF